MANRLINEQSPYLLQHAHNPVDWYPWGDEAFKVAKEAHKPVLVSIGYAACHWCHVMERESFENEDVASYMNEHFVCIKVDREEHPDVDHLYMDAVQAISGSGGWPLNVFVTPERAPFYGGTYFPPRPAYSRPSWPQVLERMDNIWRLQQDEVNGQAAQMLAHLQQASMRVMPAAATVLDNAVCKEIADSLMKQADKEKGGFGSAPKFPGSMAITYLLEYHHYTGDKPALAHALYSLDSMIGGGIYDQLGGGFSRYATDRNWLVPHFEKMLYDNALLILSMCEAYSLTGDKKYRQTILETIEFIERELKDESGGYYCALDADSEGVEGKFYTWTWADWVAFSGDDNGIAARYFGVAAEGNWEETNILHVARSVQDISKETGIEVDEIVQHINKIKTNLFNKRTERIRPQTDDKCLLSWNALMNTALTKAGSTLAEPLLLARASAHASWMLDTFWVDGALLHTWKAGVAKIPAKLDDYAYLVQSLLQLTSATGDNKWLLIADTLLEVVQAEFGREDGFFYYTPSTQTDIPVRKVDLNDGATPSANSVIADTLWKCGMAMEKTAWIEQAGSMLRAMASITTRYPYSFAWWGTHIQRYKAGMKTVICSGSSADEARVEIEAKFVPHAFLLTCKKEISKIPLLEKKDFGSNLYIFVCSEQACLSPVNSVSEAFGLINQ